MRGLLLLMLAGACLFAGDGAGAKYVGGTLASMKSDIEGQMSTTDDLFLAFKSKGRELHIPYTNVNLIEYGQHVDRRYLMAALISPVFILTKSRRHFLSLGYTDSEGRQQAMVFQVEKSKIRALLVSLEARTGLKIQFQDEQARKAGKG